jgi:hypothetical protein
MAAALTCQDVPSISVTYLRRRGLLSAGQQTVLHWNCGGRLIASANVTLKSTNMSVTFEIANGDAPPARLQQHVAFAWSATNFHGRRQWLACPHCGRRVGVLYAAPYFRCRRCHGLTYQSQRQPYSQRAADQADKLKRRVAGPGVTSNSDDFPPKPKRMRWRTYDALRERHEQLTDQVIFAAMAKVLQWRG